jgi:hypothetical protein
LKGTLEARDVEIEVSGASVVTLTGSAKRARLSASAASRLELGRFALGSANVKLTGASTAAINARAKLDYVLEGAARLGYRGNPAVGRAETSGASSVSRE